MDELTIGEVAKQANVHIETLRYYERQGLVPRPRRSVSNYRLYAEDTVRRVRFIKAAQELEWFAFVCTVLDSRVCGNDGSRSSKPGSANAALLRAAA